MKNASDPSSLSLSAKRREYKKVAAAGSHVSAAYAADRANMNMHARVDIFVRERERTFLLATFPLYPPLEILREPKLSFFILLSLSLSLELFSFRGWISLR